MDPPSNYPDFPTLAGQVGGTVYPIQENEALDRYLGRLQGIGVTVHEQVRLILSSPDSHPNAVHKALIGTFRDPQLLRIVTTNFDRHFTTAATERFGASIPEVFHAPALPVGGDFTGVVHIHGSVEKAAKSLVLTDSDFGRAYITEGWATRFLERLFSRYVVLFVGYSHQDMLLSYLARGLTAGSPGPGRFALTLPDDDARWKNLGIIPVHYPLCSPPEPRHAQLSLALTAWAEQSQAGALAVEERIRRIVSAGVPLDPEDRDYLEHALSEISTLRFFTRHAVGIEWLRWIEGQGAFQQLFALRSEYSDRDSELAFWLANQFACKYADEVLDLLRRNHLTLSPLIWGVIALTLFREKPESAVLCKWVSVLLNSVTPYSRDDLLEFILSKCRFPEDETSALLLLGHLTKPTIRLKQGLRWSEGDAEPGTATDVELDCAGSEHWLQHAWNSFFMPNLDRLARRLAPIVVSHLATAHELLTSFGRVNANWDPFNFSRGMIESRNQDHLHNGLSVLLDVAAAVMSWACANDHGFADGLIVQCSASESLLLKRLAIFGMSVAAHIRCDDKLRWLLRNNLLYSGGTKHEVFLLIRAAYPQAEAETRAEFIGEVLKGKRPNREPEDVREYEVFNVAVWLAESAPQCELASQLLATLKEKYPTYGKREHPDMDSWIGPVISGSWHTPVASADLASYDIDKLEGAIASTPNESYPGGASREGLIQSIGECARNSHDWGIEIARQAQARSIWSREIWQALIGAWGAADLSDEEWRAVLDVLDSSPAVHECALYDIASLLERGIQSSKAPVPASLIPQAKSVADQVWPLCEKLESRISGPSIDWLARAINHPAGSLTEFYLESLSRLKREGLLGDHELAEYESVFLSAFEGTSPAAELARVVLASQLHFLFYLDEHWTVQHAFPVLDPDRDARRAAQCWHGFLHWGRWTDPMLVNLMPSYERMFPRVDSEPEEIRRSFCGHLAGIAVYSLLDPLGNGWLYRFLAAVKVDTRTAWVWAMHSVIGGLDDGAKVHLWQRWLRAYWRQRLQGIPLPLEPAETGLMLEWVLNLGPVLPEVVELICAGPYPTLQHSMLYYSVAESALLKQYPDAFAKLLAFLTAGENRREIYDLDRLTRAAEELITLIPSNPVLRTLCNELVRLGVPGVAALAARLTDSVD
ncbi:MAG: DUF4020 domain-containing protein [Terriglobales bacterium]